MADETQALDAQDVANLLQVSKNTVYNLVNTGQIASYHVGRKLRFRLHDVNAYIAHAQQRKISSIQTPPDSSNQQEDSAHLSQQPRSLTPRAEPVVSTAPSALCIGGSDIAADILANWIHQSGSHATRVFEESYQALQDMYLDAVDAAVIHLYDHKTKRYNIPYVQRLVPGVALTIIHLAIRRIGLIVPQGNPDQVRSWRDLLKPHIIIANQIAGSGERIMLDEMLLSLESGLMRPNGYTHIYASPLAAARAVASGQARVAIGNERTFHQVEKVDFLPLAHESLDFVVRKSPAHEKTIRAINTFTQSSGFAAELARVGYDTRHTGKILYEV